jgi:hypothetical protein
MKKEISVSHQATRGFQLALVACLGLACAQRVIAEEFSFMIGSPVAAQSFHAKSAVFVFRAKGCGEPATLRVSGTAEGLVNGARRSVRLTRLTAMSTPGVYAVDREWPVEGLWLINLTGHCSPASAGALVPVGPKGFLRESSKFFPRAATDAEIEALLKSLATTPGEVSPGAKK